MLWVGEDGRDICDGWALSDENETLLSPHWRGLEEYAKPKSSFRDSRFQLRALKQEQNETIETYMTRACIITNNCEYTDREEQLMDKLIAGMYSDHIRRKLIAQNKETTLDQALAIVRAYESTERHMGDIKDTKQIQSVSKQHSHKTPEKMRPDLHSCYRCGKTHARNDKCPAADSLCRYCNVMGHWACEYLKKKRDSGVRHQQPHQNRFKSSKHAYHGRKTVHTVRNNDDSDRDEHFVLDSIETAPVAKLESIYKKGSKSQAFANIQMRGQTTDILVECKIDSGAEVNVMPLRVYKHLFPEQKDIHGRPIALQKSKVRLSAYGDANVKQYECFTLQCTHNDIALNVEFHVTGDAGSTMLGLQAYLALQLISRNCEHKSACNDCHNNSQVHTLSSGEGNGDAKEKLLEKYPKCFRGVGLFSGEYHIDLKQDAEPVIHPPRRVPESIKDAVKKEL